MSRQRIALTWPIVCILACLFVLSATAPSLWEQKARERAERRTAARLEAQLRAADARHSPSTSEEATASIEPGMPADPAIAAGALPPKSATPEPEPADPDPGLRQIAPAERIAGRPAVAAQPAPAPEMPAKATPSGPSFEVAIRPAPRQEGPSEAARPAPAAALPSQPLPEEPLPKEPPPEPALPESPVEEPSPAGNGRWQTPAALLAQLDELLCECETGCWAMAVDRGVRKLGIALDRPGEDAGRVLDALDRLRKEVEPLAARLGDESLAAALRRTGFALDRRLVLWRGAVLAGGLAAGPAGPKEIDPQRLALCLNDAEALTRGSSQASAWSQFLTLDALRELTAGREAEDAQRRLAARAVLDRLVAVRTSPEQRQFLNEPAMVSLRQELRRWADGPVEMASLLRHVEQYEQSGAPSDARLVAESCQRLAVSDTPARRQLAMDLESHYRNANVRIAASDEFLNRFIPERAPEHGAVDDFVLGKRVRGHSVTSTQVKVRLAPDAGRLRMVLQIDGLVSSLTRSSSGPARFLSDSRATYSAWKEVTIGPEGMRLLPAQVGVNSDMRLRQLSTDFDGVPLIGAIVHEVARSGHESRRGEANAEIQEKVSLRARQQIDAEADARLGGLGRGLEEKLVRPLADLSLGPTIVTAETTERRVVLRVRLAADDQLGGHTPRPMAPADSLASFQIHETALANLVGRLRLDGRTLTLPELRRLIAQYFNRPEIAQKETEHDDLAITFAPQNAVRVRCNGGQVAITLAVTRLTKGEQTFEDFEVRAVYRPQVNGRTAELVREDVVQLLGEKMNTRSQIALRGIFSKAFSKQKPWKLVPDRIAQDPRMAGLGVTQLAAEDGWLGVAIGHHAPPPAQPAVARRPRQALIPQRRPAR